MTNDEQVVVRLEEIISAQPDWVQVNYWPYEQDHKSQGTNSQEAKESKPFDQVIRPIGFDTRKTNP